MKETKELMVGLFLLLIQFCISVASDYSITILNVSMRAWEKATCLTFVPKSPADVNFVYFTRTDCGCCTPVGNKRNGSQFFSISPNCSQMGNIMHELGHTIGFYHEQSRPDRDKYVHVHYENIDKHLQHNFKLYKDLNSLGEPYDFESIMHYPLVYPAKGGKTIMSVVDGRPRQTLTKVGQRSVLSTGDIRQTNKLYKCPECGETLTKSNGTFDYQGAELKTRYLMKKHFDRALCQWRIIAIPSDIIELKIERARIPNNKNCSSYLVIRDGYYNSPTLMKICGAAIKKPRTIRSTGPRMFVEFKLAPGGRFWTPGLKVHYRAITFKKLEEESGNFTSPNYPSFYPLFKLCHFLIKTPNSTFVRLHFHSVEIGEDDLCDEEFIDVRDGEFENVRSIGKFCGNKSDLLFYSSSNSLLVIFQSFISTNMRGFTASYSTETVKFWKKFKSPNRMLLVKGSKGLKSTKRVDNDTQITKSTKMPLKPVETPKKGSKRKDKQ